MMLKVFEAFSGIGAQAKALERIKDRYGFAYEIVNTSEWDVYAIVAYDLIHNGPQNLSAIERIAKEGIDEHLKKYVLSSNGKDPFKGKGVLSFNESVKKRILAAIIRSKNLGSITEIHASDLPEELDVFTYSFPCQNLSIASVIHGHMTGIDKNVRNRSGMLWEVERILDECYQDGDKKMPRFMLMENVTTLLSPKFRDSFDSWKMKLEALGYINVVYRLTATDFGIPQRRTRLFMISVYTKNIKDDVCVLIRNYLDQHNLQTDLDYVRTLSITRRKRDDLLRFDYSNPKYKMEADESRLPNTPSRIGIVERNPHIYDRTECGNFCVDVINTITTRQDRNPTTGVIRYGNITEDYLDYRYLTPRECFLLMGFDEKDYDILLDNNFMLTNKKLFFSNQKLEKMAGNSIVVSVLEALFIQINEIKSIIELN